MHARCGTLEIGEMRNGRRTDAETDHDAERSSFHYRFARGLTVIEKTTPACAGTEHTRASMIDAVLRLLEVT
jgi:hypothetical protein